jgi:isopentenyl-diphosphate delta-isomerase
MQHRDSISHRKDAHLDLCLNEQVESAGLATGLGGYRLEYDALPELDLEAVDLGVEVFGRRLRAPLIVGAMTGGTERAKRINGRLARAAAKVGIGMALGSQRAMIARPELTDTFSVRDLAPDLPLLLGNVGAVQLNYGVTPAAIAEAARAVAADAVYLHLNPLQEAIQVEGDTRFSGLSEAIGRLAEEFPLPLLIKEVGAGLSARSVEKLQRLPIAGVEAAGVGGTSWARVEAYRAPSESVQAEAGQRLAGFGVPTAESIIHCRRAFPTRLVIGSGGMRHGLDLALGLALGADLVAMARPLLLVAEQSEEAVVELLNALIFELRVICFCTGARDVASLRRVQVIPPFASSHAVEHFLGEDRLTKSRGAAQVEGVVETR